MNYLNLEIATPDIIAICALIVSIFSLIISAQFNRKTFKLNKKHDELSKKPIISTKYIYNYDLGEFEIGIENNGIGPAIIEDIVFFNGNKKSKKLKTLINDLHSSFGGEHNFNSIEGFHATFSTDYSISEGKYFKIYSDKIIDFQKNELIQLYNTIGNFEVEIVYSDIFGNKNSIIERLMN